MRLKKLALSQVEWVKFFPAYRQAGLAANSFLISGLPKFVTNATPIKARIAPAMNSDVIFSPKRTDAHKKAKTGCRYNIIEAIIGVEFLIAC